MASMSGRMDGGTILGLLRFFRCIVFRQPNRFRLGFTGRGSGVALSQYRGAVSNLAAMLSAMVSMDVMERESTREESPASRLQFWKAIRREIQPAIVSVESIVNDSKVYR